MPASRFSPEFLTPNQLEKSVKGILSDAQGGREDEAWRGVQSLMPAARRQEFIAAGIVHIVRSGHLSVERALDALEEVYDAHPQSQTLLGSLGEALELAREIGELNCAPPDHPLFANVVNTLVGFIERQRGTGLEV